MKDMAKRRTIASQSFAARSITPQSTSVLSPMKSKSAITVYAPNILPVAPYQAVSLEEAAAFDWPRSALRDPRETKGLDYEVTDLSGRDCCEPGTNCC